MISPQSAGQQKRHSTLWRSIAHNWSLYLLIAVPILVIIVFRYVPIYGAQIAFRDYQPIYGITGSPWVGWKHFLAFINNFQFKSIMKNTIMISLYSLATFPLPVVLAVLLTYIPSKKFMKTVQMVSYAPYFISTVVMAGLILQFLDMRTGMMNALLGLFGVAPINFMGRGDYFYGVYVWSGVWQSIGYNSIIYIAALSGVSTELHEAAIVDGASIVRRILSVDLPSILPTIMVLLVLNCGQILNIGFEKVLLLQNTMNLTASEIISTYVYKQGIASAVNNYSYSTAIGLFVSVVNFALLIIVNRVSRWLSGSALW